MKMVSKVTFDLNNPEEKNIELSEPEDSNRDLKAVFVLKYLPRF